MSIRVWGTSLLMFLSTVTAVGQTANRYLKAPLPNDWEESGEVFQQILPVAPNIFIFSTLMCWRSTSVFPI